MEISVPFRNKILSRIGISLSVAITASYFLWKYRLRKAKEEKELARQLALLERWNTVLFFPDFRPEDPDSMSQKLFTCLRSANVSLHVCVMTISHREIKDIFNQKCRERVTIQVFTTPFTADKLRSLEPGIEVKSYASDYSTEMHHKFVIVDDVIVCTGSANWNLVSFQTQDENIIITTNPKIVWKYRQEFERLWNGPVGNPEN